MYSKNRYEALALASLSPRERQHQAKKTVFGLDQALAMATQKKKTTTYWPYAFVALGAGVIGAGYYYVTKLKEELFIVEEALEEELADRDAERRRFFNQKSKIPVEAPLETSEPDAEPQDVQDGQDEQDEEV